MHKEWIKYVDWLKIDNWTRNWKRKLKSQASITVWTIQVARQFYLQQRTPILLHTWKVVKTPTNQDRSSSNWQSLWSKQQKSLLLLLKFNISDILQMLFELLYKALGYFNLISCFQMAEKFDLGFSAVIILTRYFPCLNRHLSRISNLEPLPLHCAWVSFNSSFKKMSKAPLVPCAMQVGVKRHIKGKTQIGRGYCRYRV
mgnify:FL=1